MNGNLNDRNDSHNVVKPTELNTRVVQVNTNTNRETILGRERANIVSATVQANNNLDKKKAEQINNKFNIEEKTQMQKFLTGVAIFMIIAIALILLFKGIKLLGDTAKTLTETTTTTTTTQSPLNKNMAYVTSNTILRKFTDSSRVLILLPHGLCVDQQSKGLYIYTTITNDSLYSSKGTYRVIGGKMQLVSDKNEIMTFTINNDGLQSEDVLLKVNSNEVKYYARDNEVLVVNGTVGKSFAAYVGGEPGTQKFIYGKSSEDNNNIVIGNNSLIAKKLPDGNVLIEKNILKAK